MFRFPLRLTLQFLFAWNNTVKLYTTSLFIPNLQVLVKLTYKNASFEIYVQCQWFETDLQQSKRSAFHYYSPPYYCPQVIFLLNRNRYLWLRRNFCNPLVEWTSHSNKKASLKASAIMLSASSSREYWTLKILWMHLITKLFFTMQNGTPKFTKSP